MQTIILCGGQGTRLKEETEYKPKPMVKIGNAPVLWHIMQLYARYGFADFVLALGFKGEAIREYFLNYEYYRNDFTITLGKHKSIRLHDHPDGPLDWKVTLADTGENAMTGSRIKQCEKYIKGDLFFATYGDGLSDVNVEELLRFHKSHGKLATLTGVNPPSRWGEVVTQKGRVVKFAEKPMEPESDHCVNGGFFVFDRAIFDYFPTGEDCVLETDVLEKLAKDGELMTYQHDGFWQGMDTYRDFLVLNKMWENGKTPWLTTKKKSGRNVLSRAGKK